MFFDQQVWKLGVFGSQDGGTAPAFPVACSLGSEIGTWVRALCLPLGNVSAGRRVTKTGRRGSVGEGAGDGGWEAGALADTVAAEKDFEKQMPQTQHKEGSVCVSL